MINIRIIIIIVYNSTNMTVLYCLTTVSSLELMYVLVFYEHISIFRMQYSKTSSFGMWMNIIIMNKH